MPIKTKKKTLITGPKERDSLKGTPNAREANMPGKINATATAKASRNSSDQLINNLARRVKKRIWNIVCNSNR